MDKIGGSQSKLAGGPAPIETSEGWLREDEIFNKLGYIDVQNLADRIRARVVFVTGLSDIVCPPSTQFAVYNKIASEKDLLVYHEYGHEYLPYLSYRTLQ